MRFSFLLAKYIFKAIIPYFVFSWLLLAVILFVQQGSRFSDIFFSPSIPNSLAWQLGFALLPSIIVFTAPMAVLVSVIIGFFRIQGDGEFVSIRAAGVGNYQILIPSLFIGIVLSVFTLLINLYGVPVAAQKIREIGIRTALFELESPIEPGVFNAELNGSTLFVREGDLESGFWKNIFIFNEITKDNLRLITSKSGRIDYKEEASELFLDDAILTTITFEKGKENIISETVKQTRYSIRTKRTEMLENLAKYESSAEELGLGELAEIAETKQGKERTEFYIVFYRRIVLSATPLIFAVLGSFLALKLNKSGKAFGVSLALVIIVFYYLSALLGEQLSRTNQIDVLTGSLFPVFGSFLLMLWLSFSDKFALKKLFVKERKEKNVIEYKSEDRLETTFYGDLKFFLLDFDIISNLFKYYVLTFAFLASIFLIFTAFELWKFAGELANGFSLLLRYLFYLLPQIYIQFAPTALMVAVLSAFVIKSRQNEVVTWTAAGRSVYRLLLPAFVLTSIFGVFNWQIQESVLPAANSIQEKLRTQIRQSKTTKNKPAKIWVADESRIYSFETVENEFDFGKALKNLTIFEFSQMNSNLVSIYKSSDAVWEKDKIYFPSGARKLSVLNGRTALSEVGEIQPDKDFNPFLKLNKKPGTLTAAQIKQQINLSDAESEKRNLSVALEKRYATPFLPFVVCLFAAPFALSLNRKGKVASIGYAVGFWLLFIGTSRIFEQFGLNGFIKPEIAVWSPLILFSIIGLFFISKIKT